MEPRDIGMGSRKTPDQGEESTILKRVKEIKENVPEKNLPQVISELEQYINLRKLYEVEYEMLPDDLREDIGTQDPITEFGRRVPDFDPWDELQDQYGPTPSSDSPQWSIEELEELVWELEK